MIFAFDSNGNLIKNITNIYDVMDDAIYLWIDTKNDADMLNDIYFNKYGIEIIDYSLEYGDTNKLYLYNASCDAFKNVAHLYTDKYNLNVHSVILNSVMKNNLTEYNILK